MASRKKYKSPPRENGIVYGPTLVTAYKSTKRSRPETPTISSSPPSHGKAAKVPRESKRRKTSQNNGDIRANPVTRSKKSAVAKTGVGAKRGRGRPRKAKVTPSPNKVEDNNLDRDQEHYKSLYLLNFPEKLTTFLKKTWVEPTEPSLSSACIAGGDGPDRIENFPFKVDPNVIRNFLGGGKNHDPTKVEVHITGQDLRRLSEKLEDLKREKALKATMAPLTNGLEMKAKGDCYYKFVRELAFPKSPFRIIVADRPWYEIKEDLEDKFHIKKRRQKKRSMAFGSFIAYRMSDWFAIKKRSHIFTRSKHRPISAHEIIHANDILIIALFPSKRVSTIYHDVGLIRFEDDETEEERLEKLLNPSASSHGLGVGLVGAPPVGYKCHNCGSSSHWRHQCKMGRRLEPKGIPKTLLSTVQTEVADHENAYVLPNGSFVEYRPQGGDEIFDRMGRVLLDSK